MAKPIKFYIDIPSWESLTPEQQEAPGYPITVGYESIEDYFQHITPANPSPVPDDVVERLVKALEDKGKPPTTTPALASDGNDEPAKKGRRKHRPPSDARLMTIEDFASSIGFGKRMVERFIAEGMPTVGDRRSRRVLVQEAQEWVIRRLQDDGSDVVHRAKLDASKRGPQ